ncbi:hypothetical protein B7934_01045 [Streptococcus agalactiae]|nr:hypothetical protein B7934_01045 [Streptococcus agalactiae]
MVLFLNKNKVVIYNNYNLKVVSSRMLFIIINKKCSQLTTLFIVLKYYCQSIDYTSSLFKV